MNRIVETFQQLKARNEKALIPYLMAGDPNSERALTYFEALIHGGADLIEIGIPYSDPVADGPTIQAAGLRAMASNTKLNDVFELVKQLRARAHQMPLLLMTYYNPILSQGEEKFLQRCQETGVDGLIIPDLPAEESQGFFKLAKEKNVNLVFLATPETSEERLKQFAEYSEGFLYLVSRYGVTGSEVGINDSINSLIQRTRNAIGPDLPIAVGFGLSSKEDIRTVLNAGAEGAVVGSALVSEVGKGTLPPLLLDRIRLLKSATRSQSSPPTSPASPPQTTPETDSSSDTHTPPQHSKSVDSTSESQAASHQPTSSDASIEAQAASPQPEQTDTTSESQTESHQPSSANASTESQAASAQPEQTDTTSESQTAPHQPSSADASTESQAPSAQPESTDTTSESQAAPHQAPPADISTESHTPPPQGDTSPADHSSDPQTPPSGNP